MNVFYIITRLPILSNDFYIKVAFGFTPGKTSPKNKKGRPRKRRTAISKSSESPVLLGFFVFRSKIKDC